MSALTNQKRINKKMMNHWFIRTPCHRYWYTGLDWVRSQLLNPISASPLLPIRKTATTDFLCLSVDIGCDLTANQDLNLPDEHAVSATLHSQDSGCPRQTLHPPDGQCQGIQHKAVACFVKDLDTKWMKACLAAWLFRLSNEKSWNRGNWTPNLTLYQLTHSTNGGKAL